MAAKSRAQVQLGKGREITGICLLGFGVFCALSLISLHAGSGTMMGPGGQATAAGLYSFAGVGAYPLVAAFLIIAIRCFRGRPLHKGASEVLGIFGIFGSGTVLLYLPFAHEESALRGPGGLIGQWLGEVAASFIGGVGAALGSAMVLAISLMVLTDVSVSEVTAVVSWALRQSGLAIAAGGRAVGQVVVAMFPEKGDREAARLEAFDEEEVDEERDGYDAEAPADNLDDTIAEPADELPEIRGFDRTIKGLPAIPLAGAKAEESAPVAAAKPRVAQVLVEWPSDDVSDDVGDDASLDVGAEEPSVAEEPGTDMTFAPEPEAAERRALAAVVAEVAAVECAAVVPAKVEAAPALAAAPPRVVVEEAAPPVIVASSERPPVPVAAPVAAPVASPIAKAAVAPVAVAGPVADLGPPIIIESEAARPKPKLDMPEERRKDDGPGFIRLSEGDYRLPGTDLLEYVPPPAQEIDKQGLYDMAARLEQAMSNYGVKGNVSAINMGPVVTMYEFAPAPGTRTGKIAQLENDLAMALEAQAVRIVAPIPGKAVVGVEVPNRTRQTVYLKEILSDDSFRAGASKLQIALGKDIKGNPVSVNLSKMPHLLVAGTTGSGKSVTVNGMIASLLYNATPEEVRFIMVDPKMLELSIYEGIPHLLLPVVTDPKKANLALRWAVDEMERRYELLAKTGVRDISSYNARLDADLKKRKDAALAADAEEAEAQAQAHAKAKKDKRLKVLITGADGQEQEVEVDSEGGTEPGVSLGAISQELEEDPSDAAAAAQAARENPAAEPARKLPYIVIVIDEFADLMMVAPKDVETSVARIAQKARAAGLHLILATQRPSVDVITGLIKANFPSRVALQVASRIDSRTILDQPGAETLLGNGDMLFSDRGTKLRRIHGAFLSDDEVHRVVNFMKVQAKPVYDMDILKPRPEEGEEGGEAPADDFHDALYDQATAIVCETRQASVSFIQRRLQIGYNRAARMVEQMERDGLVGPANGIKPREVLAPAGDYLTGAP